jgi:hypothetical protein
MFPKVKKKKLLNIKKKLKRRRRKNKIKIVRIFKLIKLNNSPTFKNKIDIRLTANNIFCTCTKIFNNRIVQSASAGMYKIKTTKKRIKYTHKKMLNIFLSKLKKKSRRNTKTSVKSFNIYSPLILSITAKKKLHKRLIKRFRKLKKRQKKVLTIIQSKKCFNGCRVSKKRRKKRLKFRIFG